MLDASKVTSNDGNTYSSTLNPVLPTTFDPSSSISTSAFTVHHPNGGCSLAIATSAVATPKTSTAQSAFLKIVLSSASFTSTLATVAPSFCLINAVFSISATSVRILIFCPGAYNGLSVSTCTKLLVDATSSRLSPSSSETTVTFVLDLYVFAFPSYIPKTYSRACNGTSTSTTPTPFSTTSTGVAFTVSSSSSSLMNRISPALVTPVYAHFDVCPATNRWSQTTTTGAPRTIKTIRRSRRIQRRKRRIGRRRRHL